MAWQTPKTDWTPADGVRDMDLNRIEGNILELYETASVKNHKVIYVSTTGNDTDGDGTASSPYASITRALSSIPRHLDGKNVTINISAGTYNEDVVVSNFCGGAIKFNGSGTITIRSLQVVACVLKVDNITINTTGAIGFTVTDGAKFITTSNIGGVNSTLCLTVSNCSYASIGGNITLNGQTTGIACNTCSGVFFSSASGSNVGTGMTASSGGIIAYGSFSATVRTAISATSTGGRINTGSQTGSPGGGGVL